MSKIDLTATEAEPHPDNASEHQFFERLLRRYPGEGDCAYERSLNQLYQRLYEQRCNQLDALRRAGL